MWAALLLTLCGSHFLRLRWQRNSCTLPWNSWLVSQLSASVQLYCQTQSPLEKTNKHRIQALNTKTQILKQHDTSILRITQPYIKFLNRGKHYKSICLALRFKKKNPLTVIIQATWNLFKLAFLNTAHNDAVLKVVQYALKGLIVPWFEHM